MSFEQAINDINIFAAHENRAIAEFAHKAVYYGQALKDGTITQEEYHALMGDLNLLQGMCSTADEQMQVAKLSQCVMMLPALI